MKAVHDWHHRQLSERKPTRRVYKQANQYAIVCFMKVTKDDKEKSTCSTCLCRVSYASQHGKLAEHAFRWDKTTFHYIRDYHVARPIAIQKSRDFPLSPFFSHLSSATISMVKLKSKRLLSFADLSLRASHSLLSLYLTGCYLYSNPIKYETAADWTLKARQLDHRSRFLK